MTNGRPPRVPIYGYDRTEAPGCKYEEPTELLSTKRMSAEEYNRASLQTIMLTSPVEVRRLEDRRNVISVEVNNLSHAFEDGIKGQLRGRFMIWIEPW